MVANKTEEHNNPLINKNIIVDELKQHLDSMFNFASNVPYKKNHLLPLIQASKSLIGLNLDNPPRNLLKWLEQYFKGFEPNHQLLEYLNDEEKHNILSIQHLEELIINKMTKESRKYLYHLLKVADSRHIMEAILELSLQFSTASTLFCWSAFKSILFIDNAIGIISLSMDCLEKNNQGKDANQNLRDDFYFYCHYHQMIKTEMVRFNKINPKLCNKMKSLKDVEKYFINIPEKLVTYIQKDGEKGLVHYLLELKINELSSENILLLDALRSAIRYSSNTENIFDYSIK